MSNKIKKYFFKKPKISTWDLSQIGDKYDDNTVLQVTCLMLESHVIISV